jgi:hypothetical protein
VCVRATRTLNFITCNIYRCPSDSKSLAFTSLVRPLHRYASGAWDPHTAKNVNSLEMVQRRAARFVKKDYRRTTSASSLIDGQPYLAGENHRAYAHSTKPTTTCHRYHAITLLNHLVQHVPLLMVLVFLPCPATQMFSNSHFFPGQLLIGKAGKAVASASPNQQLTLTVDAFRNGLHFQ